MTRCEIGRDVGGYGTGTVKVEMINAKAALSLFEGLHGVTRNYMAIATEFVVDDADEKGQAFDHEMQRREVAEEAKSKAGNKRGRKVKRRNLRGLVKERKIRKMKTEEKDKITDFIEKNDKKRVESNKAKSTSTKKQVIKKKQQRLKKSWKSRQSGVKAA